jgi:predicted  nucleic acid-binding Zn-ribbon protein
MSTLGGIYVCGNNHVFKTISHGGYTEKTIEEIEKSGCPCGSKIFRFVPENVVDKVKITGREKFIVEIELPVVDLSEVDTYYSELEDIFKYAAERAVFPDFD